MRFVSRPAFFNDIGLQVDRARTSTSSPELTRSTGAPAASYQPHATVCGVGISVCFAPTRGDDQSSAAPLVPCCMGDPETTGGVWHPSASTPLTITALISVR